MANHLMSVLVLVAFVLLVRSVIKDYVRSYKIEKELEEIEKRYIRKNDR